MSLNTAARTSALSLLVWAVTTGCTVQTNGSSPSECRVDGNVSCTGNFLGYSCQGDLQPSLDCGAGTTEPDGETGYCCRSGAAGACAVADQAGCAGASTGYSCTNGVLPASTNPTLSCGGGVAGPDGDALYCCVQAAPSSCMLDTSVAGCTGGSSGYSCTLADTPAQGDPTLDCSDPTPGPQGSHLYCCIAFSNATGSCAADPSVAGCAANSFGFSCTGADTPDQTLSSLVCSTATQGPNGELLYCCSNT
jgi:hypothetical protein